MCSLSSRWMTFWFFYFVLGQHNGKVRCTHFHASSNGWFVADILNATLIWDVYRPCYFTFVSKEMASETNIVNIEGSLSLHITPERCAHLSLHFGVLNQIRVNVKKIIRVNVEFSKEKRIVFKISDARSFDIRISGARFCHLSEFMWCFIDKWASIAGKCPS